MNDTIDDIHAMQEYVDEFMKQISDDIGKNITTRYKAVAAELPHGVDEAILQGIVMDEIQRWLR